MTDGFVEDVGDAIVLCAVDELDAVIGEPGGRLGAVGFSFGAAWALWLPTRRPAVSTTVVFYGSLDRTVDFLSRTLVEA